MIRVLLLVGGYGYGGWLAWHGHPRGLLIIAITAGLHLANVLLRPWHRCWACRGRRVWWLGPNHGECVVCGGAGRYPRTGARLLTPGRAARMTRRTPRRR